MRNYTFAAAVLLFGCALAAVAGARYTITEIGGDPGPPNQPYEYYAYAVNNHGEVAGAMQLPGYQAFLWDGVTTAIIRSNAQGLGINDMGQVVGHVVQGSGFLWNPPGMNSSYDFGLESIAHSINNLGQVVGARSAGVNYQIATMWEDNCVTTGLRFLPGDNDSGAYDINNLGEIVGFSGTPGFSQAVLWHQGAPVALSANRSCAYSINERGQVVGQTNRELAGTACLWQGGSEELLGTLGGAVSLARGINDLGQVVGWSDLSSSAQDRVHAFLWEDGRMYDLNDLIPPDSGWRLEEAWAINESGWIVGWGNSGHGDRGLLLKPVPEPSSLLALLCGLGGFGGMTRRRKR